MADCGATRTAYPAFQKIPRFNREVVITEKIDGTNGLVYVADHSMPLYSGGSVFGAEGSDGPIWIQAGSRNRWLTPEADNFGFAAWVRDNAEELAKLGPGHHYGEWYGKGIQRGYGLEEKRFALFNSARWTDERPECCDVVPVLYKGTADRIMYRDTLREAPWYPELEDLRSAGSRAVPGFMRPEGIVIYHTAARQLFKVLLENDELPKGLAA